MLPSGYPEDFVIEISPLSVQPHASNYPFVGPSAECFRADIQELRRFRRADEQLLYLFDLSDSRSPSLPGLLPIWGEHCPVCVNLFHLPFIYLPSSALWPAGLSVSLFSSRSLQTAKSRARVPLYSLFSALSREDPAHRYLLLQFHDMALNAFYNLRGSEHSPPQV